jgi:hypothetical protein
MYFLQRIYECIVFKLYDLLSTFHFFNRLGFENAEFLMILLLVGLMERNQL